MLLFVFINFFIIIYFFFIKIIVGSYIFLIFFNLIRVYFFKLTPFLTIIVLMKKLNEVFKLKRTLLFIFLFFSLLPFSWIFYFLLILNNISYFFLVLLGLNKNIIIKPNKLYWNEMPYVSGSYDFKTIFYEIFKLTLLKINEISYSIYYSLIKPRKSFEIKNFEYLAFRYLFPFSINYLDFILNICLNQRFEEKFAKKVWYIRIRLKIKTLLYCIIDSISQDISDDLKEENLKIKVEFFTLTKNGGDIHELVKEALKIYKPAGIIFRNTTDSRKNTPHIIFSKSDMYFSATRSSFVKFWNKDASELKVETSLGWYLGKDQQGADNFQYFLAWKKDLDFNEKFLTRPHITYGTWKAFKFKDREEFIGFYLKSYLILKFAGPESFALRGLNTKELPMEDYVELNENNPVFESEFWINVKTLSNKDFYRFVKKDLDVGHKFLFENLWKKEHKNLLPYKEYTDERF